MRFERVWHPFENWEETGFNMWGDVEDAKGFIEQAIAFTGDHKLYGEHMIRVTKEWPISCENALTDYSLNRKAWIGHAACALGIGCPEDITRKAWGFLTNEQQLLANTEADNAIRLWERGYAEGLGLPIPMEEPVLC